MTDLHRIIKERVASRGGKENNSTAGINQLLLDRAGTYNIRNFKFLTTRCPYCESGVVFDDSLFNCESCGCWLTVELIYGGASIGVMVSVVDIPTEEAEAVKVCEKPSPLISFSYPDSRAKDKVDRGKREVKQ